MFSFFLCVGGFFFTETNHCGGRHGMSQVCGAFQLKYFAGIL